LVNARETPDPQAAAELVGKFIQENGIKVLNVSGPRASKWDNGYRFAQEVIGSVIRSSLAGARRSHEG
jgi:Circularly permutated YpsA SLOG family